MTKSNYFWMASSKHNHQPPQNTAEYQKYHNLMKNRIWIVPLQQEAKRKHKKEATPHDAAGGLHVT